LLNKGGITGNRIAEKVLSDAQLQTDDFSSVRKKSRRLNPHVVRS
jgi:hypothetical protein